MKKQHIIKKLGLELHIEGGYFRRTYESGVQFEQGNGEQRKTLTSIFYLLTNEYPTGFFHKNTSDIVHYFHLGSPIKYLIIDAQGELHEEIMGSDIMQGQKLQLAVPGGCWKASQLLEGEFGLISEAVTPGFEYEDMQIATPEQMSQLYPQLFEGIKSYLKP